MQSLFQALQLASASTTNSKVGLGWVNTGTEVKACFWYSKAHWVSMDKLNWMALHNSVISGPITWAKLTMNLCIN